MGRWSTRSCDDCGTELRIHEDWSDPPRLCKSCRERRRAQWYEVACGLCGCGIRAHRDWEKPPRCSVG